MADVCVEAVLAQTGRSAEDADSALARIELMKDVIIRSGYDPNYKSLESFAKELAKTNIMQAESKQRQAILAISNQQSMYDRMMNRMKLGMNPLHAITAELQGRQMNVIDAKNSLSAVMVAREAKYNAPILNFLKANPEFRHTMVSLGPVHVTPSARAGYASMNADIVRELSAIDPNSGLKPGYTKNAKAQEFAELINDVNLLAVAEHNRYGGGINPVPGYRPQHHDDFKLVYGRKGMFKRGDTRNADEWVEYILPRLDLMRSFGDVLDRVGADGFDAEVRSIMAGMFGAITTNRRRGNLLVASKKNISPTGMIAKLGRDRVLHFSGPEQWLEYMDMYGSGDILTGTMTHLRRLARQTSVMERISAAPDWTMTKLLDRLVEDVNNKAEWTRGLTEKQTRELRSNIDPNTVAGRKKTLGHAMFSLLDEDLTGGDIRWARIGSDVRSVVSMAKLGFTPLTALSDLSNIMRNFRVAGDGHFESMFKTVRTITEGFSAKKMSNFSTIMNAFGDGYMAGMNRYDPNAAYPGMMSKLQGTFHRMSGLTGWTDSVRNGFVHALMSEMSLNSGKTFDQLDEPFRVMMQKHGVDADYWGAFRKMEMEAPNGRKYVVPEGVENLTKEDLLPWLKDADPGIKVGTLIEQAKADIEDKLWQVAGAEVDNAVLIQTAETRAFMQRGTVAGTMTGELLRFMGQFKSFPINAAQEHFRPQIMAMKHPELYGRAGSGRGGHITDMAVHIATGFTLAALANTLSDLAKGREPVGPMSEDAYNDFFLRSFNRFGLGTIFGDVLLGEYHHYNRSFQAMAMGPVFGTVNDIATIAASAIHEGNLEGWKALQLAYKNTPFINLLYTKKIFDALIGDAIMRQAYPKAAQRREDEQLF